MGPLFPCPNSKKPMKKYQGHLMGPPTDPEFPNEASFQLLQKETYRGLVPGRTDNSWGPRAIGHHGAPVSLPKLKKAYEKGTRGISWGPLLTPGPRTVPEFPNGQSAPVQS
ncbi:unnamed protein product [Staurois parvus]|uniref:Uncharacterized protein n=1 Tax=Staurois parvus TaxID=386267 RepID=A0ABN9D1D4_9NEOB|nr:unnamed protein product [Staurois parvus]